jgi:antitoxin MazE
MQVGRWGNSLAVRLPAAVVEALDLKEGDDITIEVTDGGHFRVARDPRRSEALETLHSLGWRLPEDFRFDRDEANAREA